MLTKVLVYAYCVGVFSSRKIRQRLIEDAAFRALDRRQCAGPSHDRRLRKRRLWALKISSSRCWAWLANWGATCVGRVAREGQDRSERLENEAIRYGRTQDVRRISRSAECPLSDPDGHKAPTFPPAGETTAFELREPGLAPELSLTLPPEPTGLRRSGAQVDVWRRMRQAPSGNVGVNANPGFNAHRTVHTAGRQPIDPKSRRDAVLRRSIQAKQPVAPSTRACSSCSAMR